MPIELIWYLFDIDIVFTYGSLMAIVEKFSFLVVESVFFWVLLENKQGLRMGEFDKHLNGSYFVLNSLCNLGWFFMLIYSIFLANLDVLQVYRWQMAIRVSLGHFGAFSAKAEN